MRGISWSRLAAWLFTWVLISVVLVFLVIRASTDLANLSSGSIPPVGDFDRRYALDPLLAYLHIVPGVVYLLGAPLQLSSRIRSGHLRFHRAWGKIVLASGLFTGIFAIAVGVVMPFGGLAETSATIVFGTYFLVALVTAYRSIRSGRVDQHRRWMIRAFAVGLGVGMIRIWVGLFQAMQVLDFEAAFGLSFWVAFSIHAISAELWVRSRPAPYAY